MKSLLAPMEGLVDDVMRDLLTRNGGVDRCVAEFVRVSGTLLPDRVFLKVVPELLRGSRTPSGVPVRPQLMGSDAACLADNAAKLAALGAEGVDLNFGCPAKTVNRHRGGAVLLDEPELVGAIVAAVRRAVPRALPVSAKMRLGYRDALRTLECAQAIAAAGAAEVVVHARTQVDGYRPPAYWERIAAIRAAVAIPVVANGEVWTVADAWRCRAVTGCDALMLGRGLVSDPGLAAAIAGGTTVTTWSAVLSMLRVYWASVCERVPPAARPGRMKQWLTYLRRRFPEAEAAFVRVRRLDDPQRFSALLFAPTSAVPPPQLPSRPVRARAELPPRRREAA